MLTIYNTDQNRIYSSSSEIDDYAVIPSGQTLIAPPQLSNGEVAKLTYGASTWTVLQSYPQPEQIQYAKSPDQIRAEIISTVSTKLDDFANTRNYDSILSATTYSTSTNAQFAAEGQRAIQLRDATWTKLYEILDQVMSGSRAMPMSYADIQSELPELSWE